MKKTGFQLLLFLILLAIFSACDKNKVFEEYKSIPQTGWNKDSLLVFEIPIQDTLQNHNLFINVRNDIKYKYSNLWLFIEIASPDGKTNTDTFEITLADPTGKWMGTGFGGIKTRQVVYKRNVFFPASGNYTINIQQGMRNINLSGISDIGFRIEKQE